MEGRKTEEARPGCNRRARHAANGGLSLTPAAKDCIFAMVMLVLCLGLVWGVSAMYQKGYVEGYQAAKEACNG